MCTVSDDRDLPDDGEKTTEKCGTETKEENGSGKGHKKLLVYHFICNTYLSSRGQNIDFVDKVSMFPAKDTDAEETKETETRDNRGCFLNCKDWCCCRKGKKLKLTMLICNIVLLRYYYVQ